MLLLVVVPQHLLIHSLPDLNNVSWVSSHLIPIVWITKASCLSCLDISCGKNKCFQKANAFVSEDRNHWARQHVRRQRDEQRSSRFWMACDFRSALTFTAALDCSDVLFFPVQFLITAMPREHFLLKLILDEVIVLCTRVTKWFRFLCLLLSRYFGVLDTQPW